MDRWNGTDPARGALLENSKLNGPKLALRDFSSFSLRLLRFKLVDFEGLKNREFGEKTPAET